MASRLVILAVLVLAAVAAADSFRAEANERVVPTERTQSRRLVVNTAPEYIAKGGAMHTRVTQRGRPYLSAAEIDAAFPAPLEGLPFDVAYLAVGPDGTLALAVYKFRPTGPIRVGLELWRERKLIGAFTVPTRSFGGGLGFTADGRLVATVSQDGRSALLFRHDGERVARIPVTSW